MTEDKHDKGLDALEADLASVDPADAPEVAEELASVMSEELDETAVDDESIAERPS